MRIPITRPLAAASMSGGDSDSAPIQSLLLLFRQIAYVGDETLDLVVRYFAFVCRHFLAHTIRDAIVQLRVRLLMHVVGPKVLDPQLFPRWPTAASIV